MFRLNEVTAGIDLVLYTLERLRQHALLVIWVLLGLTLSASLAGGLTLYVDAVYTGLLDSRLSEPPYAWRWRYLGAWSGTISQADFERTQRAVSGTFAGTLGLDTIRAASYVRAGTGTARVGSYTLGQLTPAVLTGMDDAMTIVAGQWPPNTERDPSAPIPVLVSESLMGRAGVQVGDIMTAQRTGQTLTVEVAALWTPTDAASPDWIFTPKFFDDVLLMQETDFWATVASDNSIDEAAWYLNFDGAELRASDVDGVLSRAADGQRAVEAALPGIREDLSPRAALQAFNAEASSLQQQLFLIIAPVAGLVLYFVSLVAGLLVGRQLPDDVKLRSRGASRRWLLGVHGLMWTALAAGAAALGGLIAPFLVMIVARTQSFLRFDMTLPVPDATLTTEALLTGAAATGLAALGGLWMAWRSTSHDVNSYRRAEGRQRKAWWQRAYLDLILAGAAAYLLFSLWSRGGLQASADAPFQDPVTFAGPTLLAFGLVLIFLRALPWFLGVGARLIGFTRDVPLLMALRELTRSGGRYRGALLMTAFTLSLTGFTASMASTLDQSLNDTVNYRIGAELVIEPATEAQTESSNGQTSSVTGYNVPPAEDLLAIEGVESVSRLGRITARVQVGSQRYDGTVIGVDRVPLGEAAHFRDDYADEPLVGVLNHLAYERIGIVVSSRFAAQVGIVVGQEVNLEISALGQWTSLRVPVVGVVDYFPTVNPSDGFFAIANLDPLFELAGTPLPHDFWLNLAPDADSAQVVADIRASGFPLLRALDPAQALAEAQGEPARRGVLGFLSVGFVAAIALTLIATLIQITASFKAQSAQLGALRAMGLGGLAVASYVILLQGLLALSGIASGTSIGLATALTYLPLLDFSGGLPPYLVRIGWEEIAQVYAVFAGVLLAVTAITTIFLSRTRMTTVLRLGEG